MDPDCQKEMHDMRSSLMEDYKISPDIVTECSREISEHCGMHREGRTLHCLMGLARNHHKDTQDQVDLTKSCRRAVSLLSVLSITLHFSHPSTFVILVRNFDMLFLVSFLFYCVLRFITTIHLSFLTF